MRNSQISRAFAVPGLLACALLAGTILALTPGASRAQDAAATDDWKVDPMRGPVDLGLTDPSLIGAIDVHVHVDPDAPGSGGVHAPWSGARPASRAGGSSDSWERGGCVTSVPPGCAPGSRRDAARDAQPPARGIGASR
jgi:hypothetical protein